MKEDDLKKLSDEFNNEDIDYSMSDEGACSAEFSGGCIQCEEQS